MLQFIGRIISWLEETLSERAYLMRRHPYLFEPGPYTGITREDIVILPMPPAVQVACELAKTRHRRTQRVRMR